MPSPARLLALAAALALLALTPAVHAQKPRAASALELGTDPSIEAAVPTADGFAAVRSGRVLSLTGIDAVAAKVPGGKTNLALGAAIIVIGILAFVGGAVACMWSCETGASGCLMTHAGEVGFSSHMR